MGKRKSSRKPVDRKKQQARFHVMPSAFNCVLCSNEGSVQIELRKQENKAVVYCKVCSEKWETKLKSFTEPVDVYTEWTDACVEVLKKTEEDQAQ